MRYCMATAKLTLFGEYIKAQYRQRGWKQNELARKAGIDSGNLSRILHGKHAITHEAAEGLADALGLSLATVKKMAGLRELKPHATRDPSVEHLAEQLDRLPDEVRIEAVDALAAQLDAIYRVSGLKPTKKAAEAITADYGVLSERENLSRLLEIIERKDPQFLAEVMYDLKALEETPDVPETSGEAGQGH